MSVTWQAVKACAAEDRPTSEATTAALMVFFVIVFIILPLKILYNGEDPPEKNYVTFPILVQP